VRKLASRFSFGKDDPLEAGQRARRQGYYTRRDFLILGDWKSPRSHPLLSDASNTESLIREVTGVALSAKHEELRIGALTVLRGVGWPIASVLLHFASNDRYPILDYRALQSLGVSTPQTYTFDFWWAYTMECRRIAKAARVTMRELDRALWQHSKERG
jgi:hypothetical protein